MTILLVEDEEKITRFIKRGLELEHFTVDVAYDGEEALKLIEINGYDLVVLDLMLPKKDGIEVCREIRKNGISTPILMLTAKDLVDDKIAGLDSGADDYMVKPFAFGELLARIRALLRRERSVKQTKLQIDDLVLDPATHEVQRAGKEIELTSKEYRLLDYFMRHPNQVCTRTMIGEHVWGYNFSQNSNVIDVYISYLRKKVDSGFQSKIFSTVRDVGYRLRGNVVNEKIQKVGDAVAEKQR
ncbi:MAG: response regulator transcription factor [bacterium]